MADKETKRKPPVLIDYGADEDENVVGELSGTEFRDYWSTKLMRQHRMGALPWSIKDKVLWKRLVGTYATDDLFTMIDWWMLHSTNPHNFVEFYTQITAIHNKTKEKDYGWDEE